MLDVWPPLVGGLVLLIVGGELLVRGAVQVATGLGVSPLVIGLTLVGFGTSTPELVTSVQAALTGALADASYLAIGGAFSGATDQALPMTMGTARHITDTSQVVHIPGLVGIARLTSPPAGSSPIDHLFAFDLVEPVEPDFFFVQISNGVGKPVWQVFAPADARSFRLPDFPDLSTIVPGSPPNPYVPGTYLVDIFGAKLPPGFDYAHFSYADVSFDQWVAYSHSRTVVQF